jgi:hypothetical protein
MSKKDRKIKTNSQKSARREYWTAVKSNLTSLLPFLGFALMIGSFIYILCFLWIA